MKQFGLSSKERIKSKKEFDLVYSEGEVVFSSSLRLKAAFYIDRNSDTAGIKTAYAVSRKSGNAVWRNRFKRLLRESFRLNKIDLCNYCTENKIGLLLIFSSNTLNQKKNKKLSLKDIMPDVLDLMDKLRKIF